MKTLYLALLIVALLAVLSSAPPATADALPACRMLPQHGLLQQHAYGRLLPDGTVRGRLICLYIADRPAPVKRLCRYANPAAVQRKAVYRTTRLFGRVAKCVYKLPSS